MNAMTSKNLNVKPSDLVRSGDAARILGVTREYIRQMVESERLQPKFIFNSGTKRKIYVFDKRDIEKFADPATRKKISYQEPERCPLMTASEVCKVIKTRPDRIKNAMNRGYLKPRFTITGGGKRPLYLFDKDETAAAIRECAASHKYHSGHREKTLKIIERIKQLHKQGLNDRDISIKLQKAQPFIFRLRKELGLISNARIATAKRRAELAKLERKASDKKRKTTRGAARKLKSKHQ